MTCQNKQRGALTLNWPRDGGFWLVNVWGKSKSIAIFHQIKDGWVSRGQDDGIKEQRNSMVKLGARESSFRQEEARTNLGGIEGAGWSLSLRASSTFFRLG